MTNDDERDFEEERWQDQDAGEQAAPAVKPGTRCECTDHEVYADWYKGPRKPHHECHTDAVRMVTVPMENDDPTDTRCGEKFDVLLPMCEPCARWHEGGGK